MSAELEMEVVATGLLFPEGPIALADGSVLVVEIKRQTLSRIAPDGTVSVVAALGGGPNGAAIGPDGAVYICNNGGFNWVELPGGLNLPHHQASDYVSGSIQRVDLKTGAVKVLYTSCDGAKLRGPNDIVFDARGGFWFTDLGKDTAEYQQFGRIFYAKIDGSHISQQKDRLLWPNGCGLSPDGGTLYVAETWTSRLWAYEIESPGVLKPSGDPFLPGRLVAAMPDMHPFDSLGMEANGSVCVATCLKSGISVFAPDGSSEFVPVPDIVTTNICFGGADMRDAWITGSSSGKLFKTRWPRPGLRLNFNA